MSDRSPPAHIVIVDKDVAIRNALTFSLEMAGFTVESYPSGEALLEAALPSRMCLIIGYELSGLNGLQLLETLRRRAIASPAILTVTNPTRRHWAAAAAAGVAIVEKPLLSEDLEDAVRVALQTSNDQAQMNLAS